MGARESIPVDNDLVAGLLKYLRTSGEASDGITCIERIKVLQACDILENLWNTLNGWKAVEKNADQDTLF